MSSGCVDSVESSQDKEETGVSKPLTGSVDNIDFSLYQKWLK